MGGTFNPVHLIHSYILSESAKVLNASEKYYLINNIPPHKEKFNISNQHRLNMLQIQANIDGSKIIDYELYSDEISYTYKTIKYLKKKNPNWDIYFLIGQDNVNILDTWYEIEKLKKLVTFIGIERKGISMENTDVKYINLKNISDVSSTSIRNRDFSNVNSNVLSYIIENNLYKN